MTNVLTLIDPATLQTVEINAQVYYFVFDFTFVFRLAYFKDPFEVFMGPNTMVEFYVMDAEEIEDFHRGAGHGSVSTKHQLSHLWVSRASEVGTPDAPIYSVRTHLGKILRIGDSVMGNFATNAVHLSDVICILGYDLVNTNVNNPLFDLIPEDQRPDVILVRKVHQKAGDVQNEFE